ncbi:fluoride efflux transporter CrcB [Acinetobacter sp.]|jgi:fluoride exporter|uniref:fluoride efflux transporter CrcB n=1 Tax=Acinetobacter sp. TaxID=472 RepID=UPI003BB169B4
MGWLWVAMGGAIGASLRYAAGLWLFKPQMQFPWPTWWINILGCLCAGIFFACSQKYPALQQEARLFLMVGILGGFTTFSSFGLESFVLLKQGAMGLALLYALSSLIVGIIVLALGFYFTSLVLAQS